MSWDVTGLDVIGVPLVVLPGSTALTESFAVSDVVWLEFRPFIVPRDVTVHDGFDGISFVV